MADIEGLFGDPDFYCLNLDIDSKNWFETSEDLCEDIVD